MVDNLSHPANTPEPKFSKFFGNVIFFNEVLLLNTPLPIEINESGNFTVLR
mgnify:CR=1 FL=1